MTQREANMAQAHGKAAAPAKQGRAVGGSTTISASVASSLARRLEAFVQRTCWPQSRIIGRALDLYMELPPVALQRMTELGHRIGEDRLREAVAQAVEHAVDQLEWDAVAEDTARELAGRLSAEPNEEELVRHTEEAIAASRAARRRR